MRSRTANESAANAVAPARLCTFNVGVPFVWGAILAVSLQERTIALGGDHAVRAYAIVAASGAAVATDSYRSSSVPRRIGVARAVSRDAYNATGVVLAVPALAAFFFATTYAWLVVGAIAAGLTCAYAFTATYV